ncbi:BRE1-domain-containing protein [Cubamyces lactineus]|nr:BRE1-domain-containing protein [Cubamyces lactineus]
MESRKRPHVDDGDSSRPKKRAVSDDRASPSHLNGTASHSDEPKDGDHVELFRKEAIYRRMKHYSREAERSQARVAELERRRTQCEAGLAALEACWTQLIGTIRSLVRPEDLPAVEKESEGIRDLTVHVSSEAEPEYVNALKDKMQATADIVKAFVNLRAQSQTGPSEEQIAKRCQEAEAESSVLRSELSLVRARLRDTETRNEQLREELVAAEKRADRLQSKSLNPGAAKVKDDVAEGSPAEDASSPQPESVKNGLHLASDADDWRTLAESREGKIDELSRENAQQREQLHALRLQLAALPEEVVRESTHYKVLLEKASRSEHASREAAAELAKLKDELQQLQAIHQQWQESVKAGNDTAMQELKAMINKRDSELGRIREQRDQYYAELNERRAKESTKLASIAEFKTLAEARAERIAVLESESKRLKSRLAANSGDEDLVAFLWSSSSEGPSYVEDLKRRVSDAEARAFTLEKALAALDSERADIAKLSRSEAELRQQVDQLSKQLERYQTVYGNASSMPPEAAQLSEQLQRKQVEIDKLQLQDKQREQAESALFAELDKLSAAWENLDRQINSKVYDLSALEERVQKAGVERAKAENKFYAAVRDKEAVDNERKNLVRNLDKAGKALDKLAASEKALNTRIHDLEKEVSLSRKAVDALKEETRALQADNHEWRTRFYGERKSLEETRTAFQEHSAALDKKRTELRKLEESLLKAKRDVEKQATKFKSMSSSSNPNSREAELQSEVDKCMSLLKCSTCKMNLRNTVITKCMHSFCKSCVEARITTRQRKCPACNLPFSQGEVQQLYFQ